MVWKKRLIHKTLLYSRVDKMCLETSGVSKTVLMDISKQIMSSSWTPHSLTCCSWFWQYGIGICCLLIISKIVFNIYKIGSVFNEILTRVLCELILGPTFFYLFTYDLTFFIKDIKFCNCTDTSIFMLIDLWKGNLIIFL